MRCASSSVLWSCSSACRSLSSLVVSVVVMAFPLIGTDQMGTNRGNSTRSGLLRAPVEIRRGPAASSHVRIGVDELIGSELVDRARLRLALLIREGAGNDLVGDRPPLLVDRIRAEYRETPAHDRAVLLGRPGHTVVRRDPRHIAHVDLRKAAVGGEDEKTLRRPAERIRLPAVRRRDFGDLEIPCTDDLVFEALHLLRSGAARERERGERDSNDFHGVRPVSRGSAWALLDRSITPPPAPSP